MTALLFQVQYIENMKYELKHLEISQQTSIFISEIQSDIVHIFRGQYNWISKNSLQPSSWKPVYPHLNLQPSVGRAARSQGQHHLQPRKPQLLRFDLDRCSPLNTWPWVGLSGEEMYFLKMVSLSIWSLSPSSLERLLINSTLGTWHPQCSLKAVCLISSYWV